MGAGSCTSLAHVTHSHGICCGLLLLIRHWTEQVHRQKSNLSSPPALLNLMSHRDHCQRVRWMKQAMRKAVCDGTGWKTQQAGIRSLESDPRLDIPSLGPWAVSCPLWSRAAHPLTLEPSGQMLLCSQEMNAPFSFTWGRRKTELIRPNVQSFQP